jgi:DNA-binding CsgD family transcriptional regulator
VGNEAPCKLRHDGKTYAGKALLETSELLFRGETRLKIPFSAISALQARDGELHVRTKEGLSVFELGERADKWREKIANPKTLLDKLGVKNGERVSVTGEFAPDFLASLTKRGAVLQPKATKGCSWYFLAAESRQDLQQVKTIAGVVEGSAALWIVYPKGQTSITEADVRSASLLAGLTDVKVASFNATHTALKFVIPKSKR